MKNTIYGFVSGGKIGKKISSDLLKDVAQERAWPKALVVEKLVVLLIAREVIALDRCVCDLLPCAQHPLAEEAIQCHVGMQSAG